MAAACGEPRRYLRENWQLHRRIAQICRNRVLGNLYGTLLDANESELRDVPPAPQFASTVRHNLEEAHERSKETVGI